MPTRTSSGLRYGATILLIAVSLIVLAASRADAATNGVCGALSVPNPAGTVGSAGDPCLISSDADLDTAASQINADTAHTGASTADYSSPPTSTTRRTAPTPLTQHPEFGARSTGSAAPSTARATRSAT